jgi:hypothetical protein
MGVQQYGKERVAPFIFQVGIIAYGVLFFYASPFMNQSGFEKHAFGECGFSAAGVAQQNNVFYMSSIKGWHNKRFKDQKCSYLNVSLFVFTAYPLQFTENDKSRL